MKASLFILCFMLSANSGLAQSTPGDDLPPLKSQGTSISTYGIIAKNLIGFLTSYSATHDGKSPTSWADMESDGLRLEQFEQNYGVALPEVYSFIQSSGIVPDFNRGKPIIIHTAPVDYRSKGTDGRYVIWRGANGGYEFSRLPEPEIQQLIAKYNILLSTSPHPKAISRSDENKPLPDASVIKSTPETTMEAKPMEHSPKAIPTNSGRLWLWVAGIFVFAVGVITTRIYRKK